MYKFGLRELNDPRREQFPKMVVDAELAANLPSEIDYYYIYPPVDDQGPFGTCVAFGNKKVFEAFHKKRTGEEIIISGRALWSELRAKFYPGDTQDDGAQVSDALAILEENYVLDADLPYSYTSFEVNLEPVPDNLKKTDFEYKNFVRVNPTVADLKYALVHHGMCIVGGNFANEWMSPNAEGQLQSNNLTVAGGHCFSILGFNDKFVNLDGSLGAFLMVNNWTATWAKKGFAYIPYNVDPDFFPTDIFTISV